MLNFGDDFDGDWQGDVMCKQNLDRTASRLEGLNSNGTNDLFS